MEIITTLSGLDQHLLLGCDTSPSPVSDRHSGLVTFDYNFLARHHVVFYFMSGG